MGLQPVKRSKLSLLRSRKQRNYLTEEGDAALYLHTKKWNKCNRCRLCVDRENVVLWRGELPCEILFIGEAPGESEDTIGIPFVGPAGNEFDDLYAQVIGDDLTFAMTNIVACIPRDKDANLRMPKKDEAKHCSPRLQSFFEIAEPKCVVTLGKVSDRYIPDWDVPRFNLIHPSAILRAEAKQNLFRKKFILGLQKIKRSFR